MTIIGDGPQKAQLEQLAAQLELKMAKELQAGSIRFLGWLTQAKCADALAACSGLILPSLMECGGAVVLEAMASKRAVIATAWGGPTDYLDESCGILIEPHSEACMIEGLANAMTRLAEFPEQRKEMGESGYRRVLSMFDWERKIDKVLQVYASVLDDVNH